MKFWMNGRTVSSTNAYRLNNYIYGSVAPAAADPFLLQYNSAVK